MISNFVYLYAQQNQYVSVLCLMKREIAAMKLFNAVVTQFTQQGKLNVSENWQSLLHIVTVSRVYFLSVLVNPSLRYEHYYIHDQ